MLFGRKVVTLCGSTRFKQEFLEAARDEGLLGNLVFTVNWFTHTDGSCGEEAERLFQDIHFVKIDASDEIVVVNPPVPCCKTCGRWVEVVNDKLARCHQCGHIFPPAHTDLKKYIGSQTKKEIKYAEKAGKPVRYRY